MAELDDSARIFREGTLVRVFEAPVETVWRAYTEPEQLSRWWGPEGFSTPLSGIEMDVRPGGAFRLTMVLDATGSEFPSDMTFGEVVEHERLSFGWAEQRGLGAGRVTVEFTALGERTQLTTRYEGFATDEMFEASQAGWVGQLDKLERALDGS